MSTVLDQIEQQIAKLSSKAVKKNTGKIRTVADGVAKIDGLSEVMYNEMVQFPGGAIGIALNLAFVGVEGAAGLLANSVALLADAGHNLSDVLGLALKLFTQLRILSCNTNRASVEVTFSHHNAAERDQRSCGKTKFFGTQQCGDCDIPAGF